MRKQTIDAGQILEITIAQTAREGLENLSTRRIAKECGISEGSIFHYFHSKPELLAACFYHVDRQVDAQLKQVDVKLFSLRRNIRELWFLYFGYFASHGDHAKFYSQFRHSSFYTRDVMRGQTESFAFFNHFVELNKSAILIRSEVFWEFVIDTTLNLAVNVADGKFPDSPKDRERYFTLIAKGMGGVLSPGKSWAEK